MLLNFGAAAGRTSVGFIADRIGPVNAMLISVGISGLAQLLIWNFVKNYSGIVCTTTSRARRARGHSSLLTHLRLTSCR